ncbi:androgen-dependent TFPI-regulating protein isoform 2-T2 [Aphomia sociella]
MCDVALEINEINSVNRNFPIKLFVVTVFHCFICVLCFFVTLWGGWRSLTLTEEHSQVPELDNMKIFILCFLTNWNYGFQTLFLCLAVTHDVLEWTNKHDSRFGSKIRYWRDVLFCSLVVPFTLFVSGMFWSVYSVDRELVFPKVYDTIIPNWFNHCVHTNIAVVIAVESLLQPRRYATNRKLELALNLGVSVLYTIVYYSIFFFAGRWLYPLFGIMTWWQLCLFQCLIWGSIYIFYELQFPINRLIHGSESDQPNEVEESRGMNQKNGVQKNGIQENGIQKNGTATNIVENNILQNSNPDLMTPPFTTKSWSLKYRTIRDQFENSRL